MVTGSAGFIGSHAALKRLERGDSAIGFENLFESYGANLKKACLARFIDHPNSSHIHANLADHKAVDPVSKLTNANASSTSPLRLAAVRGCQIACVRAHESHVLSHYSLQWRFVKEINR